MSNMSYCRFRNTLSDLTDCSNAMMSPEEDELSQEEERARNKLIKICREIVEFADDQGL